MTHGCMLWGAALYNNGAVPVQAAALRRELQHERRAAAPADRAAADARTMPRRRASCPFSTRCRASRSRQPGNVLRIFERGGRFRPEIGIPERARGSGQAAPAGSATAAWAPRTAPTPSFVGLQKTRLFDPTLNFLGTNDHPGDYRSSGCTACHVIYANDRSPVNSGPYAKFGHRGLSSQQRPDHPARTSRAIRSSTGSPRQRIPTSQCIVCHIHPGTNVLNSYLGYMWWDEETDGELMYPPKQKHPTAEEFTQSQMSNPDETAARGNCGPTPSSWSNLADLNPQARAHAVRRLPRPRLGLPRRLQEGPQGQPARPRRPDVDHRDSSGNAELPEPAMRLDQRPRSRKTAQDQRDGVPVHLMDIHLRKGHALRRLPLRPGRPRQHQALRRGAGRPSRSSASTATAPSVNGPTLRTTGPAAYTSSPRGRPRPGGAAHAVRQAPLRARGATRSIQNSMVEDGPGAGRSSRSADTIDPGNRPHYNAKAALAKTVRFDGRRQDGLGRPARRRRGQAAPTPTANMSCIACHSSWNPSCFGCHLPQKANKKMPQLHNEGDVTRNYVSYNFQTLRDDVFMLARDGDVTGNRIGPARSSCAIHVGSYNDNRESIYVQQQTISAEGLSGIAFSTNVPHTVARRGTAKPRMCTDCHVSKQERQQRHHGPAPDAGHQLRQLHRPLLLGGGGRPRPGGRRGRPSATSRRRSSAARCTAWPIPTTTASTWSADGGWSIAHEHPGQDISDNSCHPFRKPEVLGRAGARRVPVRRLRRGRAAGLRHRLHRRQGLLGADHHGAGVAAGPAVLRPHARTPPPSPRRRPSRPTRRARTAPRTTSSRSMRCTATSTSTDKYEGLILVGAGTLLDGNPLNNFLQRELTFNPDGILCGAAAITIVGTYAYICCDAGLVVVVAGRPEEAAGDGGRSATTSLKHPQAVQVQFRYAFVCDDEGIKVLDVTDLAQPAAGQRRCSCTRRTASTWRGPTPTSRPAGEGLVILDIESRSSRGSTRSSTPAAASTTCTT